VSAGPALQMDVQRWLGRCLLRLQQYEHLLKWLLAHHEVAGPTEDWEALRERNRERIAGQTLGALANDMFETFLVDKGFERDLLPAAKKPSDRVSMAFAVRMALEPGDLERTRAAVKEMVILRNDLVHHFIDRFELWTEEGCGAALRHLEASYEIIEARYADLKSCADHLRAAAREMAAFAQTDAFRDFMVDGIAPDGSFEWPNCGIVRVLREAWHALSQDGWAPLPAVVAWVEARYPKQTPAKYGCRTWPQVVAESRQFELRYREGEGRRVGWVRERG
jgi:hypothetical protein